MAREPVSSAFMAKNVTTRDKKMHALSFTEVKVGANSPIFNKHSKVSD